MKEASQKFESLEEEHLAQMTNFMLKITKVSPGVRAVSLMTVGVGLCL